MSGIRPLTASEVEVRVGQVPKSGKGVSLLLYKDSRADMRILDEAFGPMNWQCSYEEVHGNLFCTVSVRGDDGEWVSKQDVGVESNMQAEKGEASDAFKRACFKWGIGRELYTAPFIWVPAGKCSIQQGSGRPACYDRFNVTAMECEGGRITALAIANERGAEVFSWRAQQPKRRPEQQAKPRLTPEQEKYLGLAQQVMAMSGMELKDLNAHVLKAFGFADEIPGERIGEVISYLETCLAAGTVNISVEG